MSLSQGTTATEGTWQFFKKSIIRVPSDPEVQLLRYWGEPEAYIHTAVIRILLGSLFTVAKRQKKSKQMNLYIKLVCLYDGIIYRREKEQNPAVWCSTDEPWKHPAK